MKLKNPRDYYDDPTREMICSHCRDVFCSCDDTKELPEPVAEFLKRMSWFKLGIQETRGGGWDVVLSVDGTYSRRDNLEGENSHGSDALGLMLMFHQMTGIRLADPLPEGVGTCRGCRRLIQRVEDGTLCGDCLDGNPTTGYVMKGY